MAHGGNDLKSTIIEAFEFSKDGIAIVNLDEELLYYNRAFIEIHGLGTDENYVGRKVGSLQQEKMMPLFIDMKSELLEKGFATRKFGIGRRGGGYHHVHVVSNIIDHLDPPFVVIVIREITELIKAEEELKRYRDNLQALVEERTVELKKMNDMLKKEIEDHIRAEEMLQDAGIKWRSVLENVPDFIIVIDPGHNIMFINRADEGASLEVLMGKKPYDYMLPEYHERMREVIDRTFKRGETARIECEAHRLDGSIAWFSASIGPVVRDGEVVAATMFITDISERKRSQEELEEHRDKLMKLVDKRTAELELANERLEREVKERIKAEEDLRNSEMRHRHVSEMTSDFLYSFTVEPDGTVKEDWVTDTLFEMIGFNHSETMSLGGMRGVVHPDDVDAVNRHHEVILSGRKNSSEFRIRTKEGAVRWVLDYGRPIFNEEDGRIVQIFGAVKDITERKLAEEELERRNYERGLLNDLLSIMASSKNKEAVMRETLETLTEFCGAEAAIIYEVDNEANEAVKLASVSVPEKLDSKVDCIDMKNDAIERILSVGNLVIIEEQIGNLTTPWDELKKEMNFRWTGVLVLRYGNQANAMVVIGCSEENVIGSGIRRFLEIVGNQLGIAYDRFALLETLEKREKELKRLYAWLIDSIEEERSQMALRLHDEMGQYLVALNVDFDILENKYLQSDKDGAKLLKKIRGLLQDITESTRRISYSLHPSMLEELGLIPAIHYYVDRFIKSDSLNVDVEAIGFDEKLSPQVALTLYRVIQEALANAVKHAKADRIALTLTKGYPRVIMKVEDNGVGFSMVDAPPDKGLGIIGMKERVKRLGGSFQIKSAPNKGTAIRVTIPLEVDDD